MRSAVLITLISQTLWLSGCIVSRVDPQQPQPALPAKLADVANSTAVLPTPWWTLFGDATLNALVEEALSNNPDVMVAAARVAESRARLRLVNSQRYPRLDLEGNVARSRDSEAQFGGGQFEQPRTLYTVQGVVTYEVDLWGEYARASEAARYELLNSEYAREAVKLSLTGDVARGYFALIAAAEQLVRGRETLADREESLRLERLRFDAGESDEFTYQRAQADTAATRKSVQQLELEVVQRTNALGLLLGRSPEDLVDNAVAAQGLQLPPVVVLPADLPSAVLERRPDIGAAEAALLAAAADMGVARAQIFPAISLTGILGSVSTELSELFTNPMEAWSAVGALTQPIFQGGNWRANMERTRAVREQRKAEYTRTVQTAFREVLDALQGQGFIAQARAANEEQVVALSRATDIAELRYEQGDIAYIELLDVRRGLFQAQIDLVAAHRDALLNTVDLALAVGGSLGERAEPLTVQR